MIPFQHLCHYATEHTVTRLTPPHTAAIATQWGNAASTTPSINRQIENEFENDKDERENVKINSIFQVHWLHYLLKHIIDWIDKLFFEIKSPLIESYIVCVCGEWNERKLWLAGPDFHASISGSGTIVSFTIIFQIFLIINSPQSHIEWKLNWKTRKWEWKLNWI